MDIVDSLLNVNDLWYLFKFVAMLQMRHLFIIIDMSASMEDQDLKPTRLIASLKVNLAILSYKNYVFSQIISRQKF